MSLAFRRAEDGSAEIWDDGRALVKSIRFSWQVQEPLSGGGIPQASWLVPRGSQPEGPAAALRTNLLRDGRPVGSAELRIEGRVARLGLDILEDVGGLGGRDSFERPSLGLPCFALGPGLRFLLVTFGLGASGNGHGGYWPDARLGAAVQDLPQEAFCPLVAYDDHAAVAIAPGSQFLTSALVNTPAGLARSLHGSVDRLPVGMRIETIFAVGSDVSDALLALGDHLLAAGGKTRPDPEASPVTSTLGWWNAYGSFYTEPIRPLDGGALASQLASLERDGVPLGHIGIDLWYPYEQIGQALEFVPDPRKYPGGLRALSESRHLRSALHLSALSSRNRYRVDGADPQFYADVARGLRSQGAVVAWHDWLRTQQHLTPALRAEPARAEGWFSGMARAMAAQDLGVLLCMHTMGMVLAATREPNVLAARSQIDYLFGQREALETLASLGHPGFAADWIPPDRLRRQNLLVGSVLYSLGVLPFHDLFLSAPTPGIGGASPDFEGLLRALSCGPVAIGDGPQGTNLELVGRLVGPDRQILRPDRPPLPEARTLGEPVEVYQTERRAGEARWGYVVALNTSSTQDEAWRVPDPDGESILWDPTAGCPAGRAERRIIPGGLDYVLSAPERGGIAPLGLRDKFVPAARGVLLEAHWRGGAWDLAVRAPGEVLLVWSERPVVVRDQAGRSLVVADDGPLHSVAVARDTTRLVISRR